MQKLMILEEIEKEKIELPQSNSTAEITNESMAYITLEFKHKNETIVLLEQPSEIPSDLYVEKPIKVLLEYE